MYKTGATARLRQIFEKEMRDRAVLTVELADEDEMLGAEEMLGDAARGRST